MKSQGMCTIDNVVITDVFMYYNHKYTFFHTSFSLLPRLFVAHNVIIAIHVGI